MSADAYAGLVLVAALIYFVPAIIAIVRGVAWWHGVLALNFFLGWTFLGWVAAFIWAIVAPAGGRVRQVGVMGTCADCFGVFLMPGGSVEMPCPRDRCEGRVVAGERRPGVCDKCGRPALMPAWVEALTCPHSECRGVVRLPLAPIGANSNARLTERGDTDGC